MVDVISGFCALDIQSRAANCLLKHECDACAVTGAPLARATSGQDLGDGVWPVLAALLPRTAALQVAPDPSSPAHLALLARACEAERLLVSPGLPRTPNAVSRRGVGRGGRYRGLGVWR